MSWKKKDIALFLFILILDLNYLFTNTCGMTTVGKLVFIVGAVGILLLFLLDKKLEISDAKIAFVVLLGVSFVQRSWSSMYLSAALIFVIWLFCDYKKDSTEIYKYALAVSIIGTLIWYFMLKFHIIENLEYEIFYSGWRVRSTFGFLNVNTFSAYISALALFLVLAYEKNILMWLAAALIMVFTYVKSDTRTTILTFAIFCVCYLGISLFLKIKNSRRWLKILLKIGVTIPCLLSLLSPVLLVRTPYINLILSGRLEANESFMQQFGLQTFLLGGSGTKAAVDNMYLMFIYNVGILLFFVVMYVVFQSIDQLVEERDVKSLSFLVSGFYMGLMEAALVKPGFRWSTVFWIIVFSAYERYRKNKERNRG